MAVRIANRYDIDVIVEMMKHYSKYSPIKTLQTKHNETHVRTLMTNILLGMGRAWISEIDGMPVGMLLSIRNGNMWNPDVKLQNELAFWVEPEYRNGTHAYRLLSAYEKYCEELVKNGEIEGYTMSRLHHSAFDPTKRGFRLIEETYIKQ